MVRQCQRLAYHPNLVVGQPVRVVDPVDVDPGPHLLRAILPIRSLLSLTGQVEGELSGLRVDVDVVVVLQVEKEVAVDLKAYL